MPGDNRLVLSAPVATKDGAPITGKVAYELIVNAPRATARFTGNLGTAYPPPTTARPMRRSPSATGRTASTAPIPRTAWSFVAPRGRRAAATEIRLDGGFKPGRIYQLTYTARDPIVVALGMAGIRDLLSYLREQSAGGSAGAAQER